MLGREGGLPTWRSGKEPACQGRRCQRWGLHPWVGNILWRRKWEPTPVLLPGESHGQRSLVGYSPWGRKEYDTTEQQLERAPWGPELHLKEMKLSLPHYSVPHCPHPPTSPEAGPDMTGAGSGPSPHALGSRCQESRRWFPPCYGISTPGTQQVPGCYPQRTAQRGCRTLGRFFAWPGCGVRGPGPLIPKLLASPPGLVSFAWCCALTSHRKRMLVLDAPLGPLPTWQMKANACLPTHLEQCRNRGMSSRWNWIPVHFHCLNRTSAELPQPVKNIRRANLKCCHLLELWILLYTETRHFYAPFHF